MAVAVTTIVIVVQWFFLLRPNFKPRLISLRAAGESNVPTASVSRSLEHVQCC